MRRLSATNVRIALLFQQSIRYIINNDVSEAIHVCVIPYMYHYTNGIMALGLLVLFIITDDRLVI